MHKIFGKRVWRDLKKDILRYLSLGILIVLGIYLIVSLVGSAETVITGVKVKSEKNYLEDGEFQMFVPLTKQQERQLTDTGIELEKLFYLDFIQKDGSTLRLFKNREAIDQIYIDDGELALADNEVVIERRYC